MDGCPDPEAIAIERTSDDGLISKGLEQRGGMNASVVVPNNKANSAAIVLAFAWHGIVFWARLANRRGCLSEVGANALDSAGGVVGEENGAVLGGGIRRRFIGNAIGSLVGAKLGNSATFQVADRKLLVVAGGG